MMVRSTLSPSPSRQANLSEKRVVEKEEFVCAMSRCFDSFVGERNEELQRAYSQNERRVKDAQGEAEVARVPGEAAH